MKRQKKWNGKYHGVCSRIGDALKRYAKTLIFNRQDGSVASGQWPSSVAPVPCTVLDSVDRRRCVAGRVASRVRNRTRDRPQHCTANDVFVTAPVMATRSQWCEKRRRELWATYYTRDNYMTHKVAGGRPTGLLTAVTSHSRGRCRVLFLTRPISFTERETGHGATKSQCADLWRPLARGSGSSGDQCSRQHRYLCSVISPPRDHAQQPITAAQRVRPCL